MKQFRVFVILAGALLLAAGPAFASGPGDGDPPPPTNSSAAAGTSGSSTTAVVAALLAVLGF